MHSNATVVMCTDMDSLLADGTSKPQTSNTGHQNLVHICLSKPQGLLDTTAGGTRSSYAHITTNIKKGMQQHEACAAGDAHTNDTGKAPRSYGTHK